MRKYAFADETGCTPDNVQLKPGKFLTELGSKEDLMVKTIHSSGGSPELAALVSTEDPAKHHMKLFSIEQWAMDPNVKNGKVYLVVKEVEAPVVRMEQRIMFAIATISNMVKDKAFRRWANSWMHNEDRSADSALVIADAAQEELDGIDNLVAMGISTGGSHEDMKKQKETLSRITALANAAVLATDAGKSDDDVCQLLAVATDNIQNIFKGENLIKLAQKICAKQ
ncbi:MAG: hypothetical protein ACC635_03345 [Acidiferrobacterales bacterium]